MTESLCRFSGRASRQSFWLTILSILAFGMVINVGVVLLVGVTFLVAVSGLPDAAPTGILAIGAAVLVVFGLAVFVVTLAVSVRRLHDLDHSGWWLFGYLALSSLLSVPRFGIMGPLHRMESVSILDLIGSVVGIAFLIYLGFIRGTDGPNRYGPDPRSDA